jgi:quinol monooxygenase YgiN
MAERPGVLVLGTVTTDAEHLPELLEASLEHVHRSRTEDGCISHHVTQDPEHPETLHFVERWRDRAAVHTHFEQAESLAFIEVVQRLATERTTMDVYDLVPEA